MDNRQEQLNAVTVGQIRARYMKQLELEISTLNALIRRGYHERAKAESYLSETIGVTLTRLDNINAMASTEVMFPDTAKSQ